MPEQKDRADVIYEVEDKLPVGSIEKARAGAGNQDEQYAIPAARPVPWQDV